MHYARGVVGCFKGQGQPCLMHGVTPLRVHSLAFTEPHNPIDQFAVGVPRSESLQIRHASLDNLGLWHSALHEDQVTGVSADLSHRAI